MNIIKKSFYLTSIFSDAVPDSSWTAIERKTALALFAFLDPYKIYIPDTDDEEIESLLKNIPLEFSISKKEWMDITGVTDDNFSRDIKATRQGLIKKSFNTPHPTDSDKDSGDSIAWFSKVTYSAKERNLKLKINPDALENLVSFVKYTKINFDYIKPLKSGYSVYTYIFLKIIKDISNNQKKTEEQIEIEELKQKLGLTGKYKLIKMFQERVLEVVKSEINEYTDLDFDYELEKDGRAYKWINLYFDYKKQTVIEAPKKIISIDDKFDFDISSDTDLDFDSQESIFESTLYGWGIRAKEVVRIEESYSLNAINEAIKVTEQAISGNLIKTTPAAFFLGTLENTQQAEDIEYDKQLKLQKKTNEAKILEQKERVYQTLQAKIYLYESEISKLLTAISMEANIQISDELLIELEKMNTVDKEIFNGYKSMFPVLIHGYYDFKEQKNVSPNMYNFLKLITTVKSTVPKK
uniref:Plasmid replication protein RepB n=1 Tax=Francisella tularensis subsp. novicida PA10-7858 TaxID=1386968 RepID=V5T8X9_FRANO|nr:replication initiation protein [Francisella tularensis]AHB60825.1 plasmid replication protein RepB [Francisella tularensis subsp. novicida PA10-7858]